MMKTKEVSPLCISLLKICQLKYLPGIQDGHDGGLYIVKAYPPVTCV